MSTFFEYFTDPVLRAPMIGSMLMCLASSLVGVIVFLKKESLIGETLSHAAYPGLVLGSLVIGSVLGDLTEGTWIGPMMLGGAFITSFLGIRVVGYLQRRCKVKPDAALCFVLSFFFGVGVLLASYVQFGYSNLYRHVQTVLYGQAATMTDWHIALYGSLVAFVLAILIFYRTEFKLWLFDPLYAELIGVKVHLLNQVVFALVTVSIIIGIRAVGVVLMSAMLIAPAVAARQTTSVLKRMFYWAALFGTLSASIGTFLATEVSQYFILHHPDYRLTLPTGPMIVLVAATFCIATLLFMKERGIVTRFFRLLKYRSISLRENLLKALWRKPSLSFKELREYLNVPPLLLWVYLHRLKSQGWIKKVSTKYELTQDGQTRAARIVRLHRLWELYLADYVGLVATRVHRSAEEMEHILTPELEAELTVLLKNPKEDPHKQPIPPHE